MTAQLTHYVDEIDSPLGILTVVTSERGICCICFGRLEMNIGTIYAWLRKHGRKGELINGSKYIEPVRTQIDEYFAKKRCSFDLPLDLAGTPFQLKVWKALMDIEYGTTCSYKNIALKIGAPKAVRAIGGANNKNPIPIVIPCHRVIGSNGNMVGYGGGLDKKEVLLNLEGALEKIS